MPEPLITKEEAYRNARAVLDRARLRIAADYAAGRLSPEQTTRYEHLRAKARQQAMQNAARVWRAGMDAMDRMTVEDAASACWTRGGPTLADLERRIRADREQRTSDPNQADPSTTLEP